MSDKIPLVLIPALLCDEALYRDVLTGLAAEVAPQVLMSPKPDLADSVADILSRAPDRFVVAGTSYGGRLAIELALAAPDRVQALWVMGANPGAPDREQSLGLADMIETRLDDAVAMLAGLVVAQQHTEARATFEAMARRVGSQNGAAQMRALAHGTDVMDRLASLHVPTLVLWGKQDALVPASVGRKLADTLPHAHFHELDDCGHLPTLEQPNEVVRIAAEWLGYDVRDGAAR